MCKEVLNDRLNYWTFNYLIWAYNIILASKLKTFFSNRIRACSGSGCLSASGNWQNKQMPFITIPLKVRWGIDPHQRRSTHPFRDFRKLAQSRFFADRKHCCIDPNPSKVKVWLCNTIYTGMGETDGVLGEW